MSKPAAVVLSSCPDTPASTYLDPMRLYLFTFAFGSLLLFSDMLVALVTIILPGLLPWEFDWTLSLQYLNDFANDSALFTKLLERSFTVGCALFWLHRLRHYQIRLPFHYEASQVILVAAVAMVAHGALRWITRSVTPDFVLVEYWISAIVLILAGRRTVRALLHRRGFGRLPVVVVGTGSTAATVTTLVENHLGLDYEVVGSVDPSVLAALAERDYRYDLYRRGGGISAIVTLDENPATKTVTERLLRQGLLTGAVTFASPPYFSVGRPEWTTLLGDASGFQPVFHLGSDRIMLVPRSRLSDPLSRGLKRLLDIVGAGVAILLAVTVLAPFLAWVVLAIKADGGPLLFRQRRVGHHGRLFECLKLRTMTVNAEQTLHRELLHDPEKAKEWNRDFKLRHDPRITPIGRFLRRTSLDELPQIINVLRGEMSLVGSRPIVPAEVERYGEDAAYYLRSRPGLTGLWQVSGRNDLDYPTRVRLDASYVRNWTLWNDISILLRTLPALLSGRGAC
ncbi:undecaprenyl-phosphate galactose phosphotransferase [Gammaproteobacteria bacterium]